MMQSRTAQICYKILILEDTNSFTHWHFCMKLALQDSNLLSVVDRTLAKPNMATDPDVYANWISRDLKAQLQIVTTLCYTMQGGTQCYITGYLSQGLLGLAHCLILGKRKLLHCIPHAKLLLHAAD